MTELSSPSAPSVPLKTVSSWGVSWFSAKTGAQAHVLKIRKPKTVIIKTETKKYGNMWAFTTPEKVCDLIKKNCGLYEIISDYPHKLYFDIDCKDPVLDKPILNEILELIRTIWPNGNFAVSGSVVAEKESYHLVSDTYVIHNDAERAMVKSAVKFLKTKHDAFDWKVYTPNRPMKCINQSKVDGRVQLIISEEDYKKHLICSFIPTYCEPIDCHFDEPLKEQIAIERAKGKINIAELPKLNLQAPDELNWFSMTPLDMLLLCPYKNNPKAFGYKYVHDLARFAYYNGISFEEYCAWAGWTPNAEGIKCWNNVEKFPPFRLDQMKKLLQYYYPALKRDPYMIAFLNQFQMPNDIKKTKIHRLEQAHYNPDYKATILHLTMGSGKTAQTIDYLKTSIGGFCWIAHNKALVAGTLGRLKDADVECKDYLGFNAKAKADGALNAVKNLCICAHSLHYISTEKRYTTLVIDEIESVVDAFMGDFMKENKAKSFAIFKNLILHSKKLILIDAFITMKTINLIRSIDPNCTINIVSQEILKPTKTITFNSANDETHNAGTACLGKDELGALSNALNHIIQFIKQGKRVFVFYPYKTAGASHLGMDEVEHLIKTKTNCRTVAYNADSDDKIKAGLKNVNESWKEYDCVICNQVITCGVNYDMTGFDKVFMFLASFVKPRQSIQVSARIRNLSTNEIGVYYMGRQSNTECFIDDRNQMNCPVYSRLYLDSMIEDNAPRRKAFELFCKKAPYHMERAQFVIDEGITKEIEEYQKAEYEYKFENIEEIGAGQANTIEDLIMQQDCPMYMKFELKKYYFLHKFQDEANKEILAIAWNLNLFGLVDRLIDSAMNGEGVPPYKKSVFDSIKEENQWTSIFTTPASKKQLKMSPGVIDEIFKEFKFRTLSKTSSKNQLYKSIVNTAFKANVICSNVSASRDVTFHINPDLQEHIEAIVSLCQNHARKDEKLPPMTLVEGEQMQCENEE
jgi:hypothetical protein